MQKLLDLVERTLGSSWIDIVEWLRQHEALDQVDALLADGDYAGVLHAVETAAAQAAEKFATDVHAGYTEAGQQEAAWLGDETDAVVRFNAANPRAAAWAQQNQYELVQGISQEQRELIHRVIADGVTNGVNPRELARDIKDSLGLTPDQSDWVTSYRRSLESQDYANALSRALSDGRSDRSIEAAANRGDALTAEQIDQAVERYRQNVIGYRAETIARTEALRAVHQGSDELFRQAIDNGDVEHADLEGEWVPGPATAHARILHRTSDLLAQRPHVGDPFELDDGTRMLYPGDPAGGAKHNANCRCTRAVRYAGV